MELDGKAVDVEAERTGRFERKLTVGDTTFAVLSAPQGSDYLVEVDGTVHRISGGEAGMVRAPAPAMVMSIPVSPGDEVTAGDVVAVVESMKLETALRAPVSGRVREILVAPNTQVEGGTKLVRLEPDADDDAVSGTERASLAGLATPPVAGSDAAAVAADALTSLRYLVLGYDIDERDARPLLAALNAARQDLPPDDPTVLEGELAIVPDLRRPLRAVAQPARPRGREPAGRPGGRGGAQPAGVPLRLPALPRRRRRGAARVVPRQAAPGAAPTTGCPTWSSPTRCPRRCTGCSSRTGGPTAHVPVLLDLLGWRLRHPDSLPDDVRERYQRVLDHLVSATQLRHPVVGGLARRVRYTCFDAPRDRRRAGAGPAGRARRCWTTSPTTRSSGPRRSTASWPRPIRSSGCSGAAHHAVMLEVMTRRYYRVRELTDVRVEDRGGRPLLTASYSPRGSRGPCSPPPCTPSRTRPRAPTRCRCRATCGG